MTARAPADSEHYIETPEGIVFGMSIANPIARAWAFAVDWILRVMLAIIVGLALNSLGKIGLGIYLVVFFIIWWGYDILFETFMDGATPGKRLMKLRVVNDDFTPVHFAASVIRNMIRLVDFMPGFYGLGAISVLFNTSNQRIGDIAARTVVVNVGFRPYATEAVIDEKPLLPPMVFTKEEERNIVEFAKFSQQVDEQRLDELVTELTDVFNEPDKRKLAGQLRSYAKWFVGEG